MERADSGLFGKQAGFGLGDLPGGFDEPHIAPLGLMQSPSDDVNFPSFEGLQDATLEDPYAVSVLEPAEIPFLRGASMDELQVLKAHQAAADDSGTDEDCPAPLLHSFSMTQGNDLVDESLDSEQLSGTEKRSNGDNSVEEDSSEGAGAFDSFAENSSLPSSSASAPENGDSVENERPSNKEELRNNISVSARKAKNASNSSTRDGRATQRRAGARVRGASASENAEAASTRSSGAKRRMTDDSSRSRSRSRVGSDVSDRLLHESDSARAKRLERNRKSAQQSRQRKKQMWHQLQTENDRLREDKQRLEERLKQHVDLDMFESMKAENERLKRELKTLRSSVTSMAEIIEQRKAAENAASLAAQSLREGNASKDGIVRLLCAEAGAGTPSSSNENRLSKTSASFPTRSNWYGECLSRKPSSAHNSLDNRAESLPATSGAASAAAAKVESSDTLSPPRLGSQPTSTSPARAESTSIMASIDAHWVRQYAVLVALAVALAFVPAGAGLFGHGDVSSSIDAMLMEGGLMDSKLMRATTDTLRSQGSIVGDALQQGLFSPESLRNVASSLGAMLVPILSTIVFIDSREPTEKRRLASSA